MQNFTKYFEDQRPRLRPSEHKELVKISGDRKLEIQITKTGSIETRIFTSNRKIKRCGGQLILHT